MGDSLRRVVTLGELRDRLVPIGGREALRDVVRLLPSAAADTEVDLVDLARWGQPAAAVAGLDRGDWLDRGGQRFVLALGCAAIAVGAQRCATAVAARAYGDLSREADGLLADALGAAAAVLEVVAETGSEPIADKRRSSRLYMGLLGARALPRMGHPPSLYGAAAELVMATMTLRAGSCVRAVEGAAGEDPIAVGEVVAGYLDAELRS